MKAPTALRSSRLAAVPAAAWPHIAHSRFLAEYLGAQLPEAVLDGPATLRGLDRDGAALTVEVRAAEPPAGLSLILRGSTGAQALYLALAACEGGSRLTITHEPVADDGTTSATDTPAALLAALLAAPLPAALRATIFVGADTLPAARFYLADTASAIDAMRRTMAPDQGYQRPASDRFSLAAHIWHLADIEQFGWSQRLPRALAEHEPVLAGVDGDRLAIERCYQQRPWRGAALRFVRLRQRSLRVLSRFETASLAQPLQFGGTRCSVGEMIAAMVAHDHEHRIEMAALWPPADASAAAAGGQDARRTRR
jgi:hypothetical protein